MPKPPTNGTVASPSGQHAACALTAAANAVGLWHIDLLALRTHRDYYYALLSADERARAARLKVERKRDEYVIVRGALRTCLAGVMQCAVDAIEFVFGAHGKPALAPTPGQWVHFNVSHSHDRALLAISPTFELGVDVEKIRCDIDVLTLAQRFFSPLERQTLAGLPVGQHRASFFTCWARKEAVIKCDGRGVSIGLDNFDVSLRPGEPARLLRTQWNAEDALRWSLHGVDVDRSYRAALAVRARTFRVHTFSLGAA